MAMKRCPECGEKYSDTYRYCPFCEEEEALRQGGQIRRGGRGGKRVAQGSRQPNLLSPILIVVILLLACLLVYLLFGDKIAEKLGGNQDPVTPPTADVDPVEPDVDPAEPVEPDGVMPGDPDAQGQEPTGAGTEMTYEQAAALPAGLTLSATDFSLFTVGETSTITVSGGTGSYQWFSEDEGVAAVDANGKVTAISKGDINIVVTDGKKQGACIVRVKVSGGTAAPAPSGGENQLNREDMTLSVGEKFQLKLTGVTTALTWSSANSAVASVSGDGTVAGVAPGKTTITVSWDGASRSCVVYVKQ